MYSHHVTGLIQWLSRIFVRGELQNFNHQPPCICRLSFIPFNHREKRTKSVFYFVKMKRQIETLVSKHDFTFNKMKVEFFTFLLKVSKKGKIHWITVIICTEKWFPGGSEGPDEANPNRADGHGSDEGARKRPRDADRPAVQSGQVLRHYAGAAENLARLHGQDTQQVQQLLWGLYHTIYHLQYNVAKSYTITSDIRNIPVSLWESNRDGEW